MSDKQSNPIVGFIFGLVFLVIGGSVAYVFGLPELQKAWASSDWPTVQGVVQQSEVVTHREDDSTVYSASVRYTYTVNSEPREGDILSFGDYRSSFRSGFEEKVKEYPKGKTVDVYYDPSDPSVSVLEPGTSWASYMPLGVGIVFMLIGFCLIAYVAVYLGFAVVLGATAIGASRSGQRFGQAAPSPKPMGASASKKPAGLDDDDGFDIQ